MFNPIINSKFKVIQFNGKWEYMEAKEKGGLYTIVPFLINACTLDK